MNECKVCKLYITDPNDELCIECSSLKSSWITYLSNKKWQWVYKRTPLEFDDYYVTASHYKTKEEAQAMIGEKGIVTSKILESEIED